MKQNTKNQFGFTLVELLVVISIMMMAFAIVLVGLNQQRVKRSILIAQNETVTNIRKVQSYMLSSRNIGSNNKPVKYYVVQFKKTAGNNTTYTVRAIDSDYTYYGGLETVALGDGVIIQDLVLTDRTGAVLPTGQAGQCAQLIFSAPFGKVYMDNTNCDSALKDVVKNPVAMQAKTDATLQITLQNPGGADLKTITINGFSSKVVAD